MKVKNFCFLLILSLFTMDIYAETINLFTTYYTSKNAARQKEIETCLENNINNPLLDRIFLLVEGESYHTLLENPKVVPIKILNRPTYKDFFELVNFYSIEDEINIISNSDIYFDDTLTVIDKLNMENLCLALTRWDVKSSGNVLLYPSPQWSQDVWIFKGKVKQVEGDFCLGVRGCDNRIAFELQKVGYTVLNLCKFIKTYHLHQSNFRPHALCKRIEKPYLFLKAVDEKGLENYLKLVSKL